MCWCASACLTFAAGGSCFDGGGGGRDKARQRLQQVGHEALGGHSWSKWDVGRVPGAAKERGGSGAWSRVEGRQEAASGVCPACVGLGRGRRRRELNVPVGLCTVFALGEVQANGACVRRFANKPMTSDDDDATPLRSPFPLLPQATATTTSTA